MRLSFQLLVVTSVCVNFFVYCVFCFVCNLEEIFHVVEFLIVIDGSKIQPFFIYAIVYCNYFYLNFTNDLYTTFSNIPVLLLSYQKTATYSIARIRVGSVHVLRLVSANLFVRCRSYRAVSIFQTGVFRCGIETIAHGFSAVSVSSVCI